MKPQTVNLSDVQTFLKGKGYEICRMVVDSGVMVTNTSVAYEKRVACKVVVDPASNCSCAPCESRPLINVSGFYDDHAVVMMRDIEIACFALFAFVMFLLVLRELRGFFGRKKAAAWEDKFVQINKKKT